MKASPAHRALLALFTAFLLASAGTAETIFWNGENSRDWFEENWSADAAAAQPASPLAIEGGDLIFSAVNPLFSLGSAGSQERMWLGAPRSVHSITFTHPAPASLESFSTLTIAPNGSGPGWLRVAASAGPVTLGTDLALLSPRVEVEGAGRLQIEGNISGLHLTKEGSGTLILAGALDPAMTLNVNAGTVYLIHSQRLAGLHIAAGATVVLAAHGPNEVYDSKILDLSALAIDPGGGTLDLTNNAMIVRGGSLGALTALVTQGFNASFPEALWQGTGITSSTAAAGGVRAVGVLDSGELGLSSFRGVNLSGNAVLVLFTFYGDANLTGDVDMDDYAFLDAGFGGGLSGWMLGDFKYDGVIDATDYAFIDAGFIGQHDPTTPTDTDGDGIPDWWEADFGLNPQSAADAGKTSAAGRLTNLETFLAGINPRTIDFDGDNLPDWWEVQFSLDPEDPADAGQDWDRDRATNLQEYAARTHPLDPDDHPPRPGIPAAPENVRVVTNLDGSRDIYWDDVSDNETYFVIRDLLPNGTVVELGRVGSGSTHFHVPAP